MLVYGSQEYQETLNAFAARLRERTAKLRTGSLEDLRTLLIQAGQLEQGLTDYLAAPNASEHPLVVSSMRLTDLAATAFYSAWANGYHPKAYHPTAADAHAMCLELDRLRGELPPLTIKIPEGFEFYALFPEQYCVSALRWAQAHSGASPKRALVVGIRTIGTTLSAVVKAALSALGWKADRITARPTGHPFARTVTLGREIVNHKSAVVVDEGPGLSGSSMAAVARALAARRIADIAFLPGHAGEPGTAASAEVRHWWATLPRFCTSWQDLRWKGESLPQRLAAVSIDLLGAPAIAQSRVQDFSGGLWRKQAYASEGDWPAVAATFERMKFYCPGANGDAVLWKFTGLGCAWENGVTAAEIAVNEIGSRAQNDLVPASQSVSHGFVAARWIRGARLTRAEAGDHSLVAHIAYYLTRSVGPELSVSEARASYERIKEMLCHNALETLGQPAAERAQSLAEYVVPCSSTPDLSYGDGRLAPHEWVRDTEGRIWKTDCAGHSRDHTLVGKQSILWDIAGALIEWDLPPSGAETLVSEVHRMGLPIDRDRLRFYQAAYTAFRSGLTRLATSQMAQESGERQPLEQATAYYAAKLDNLLANTKARTSGACKAG